MHLSATVLVIYEYLYASTMVSQNLEFTVVWILILCRKRVIVTFKNSRCKLGMVVHIYNPQAWEAKAGGL
jgi:hypothetical protein